MSVSAEETTLEKSGVKVVYTLSDHMESLGLGSTIDNVVVNDLKLVDYKLTDGFYSFLSNPADSTHYEGSSSGAFGFKAFSNLKKRFIVTR